MNLPLAPWRRGAYTTARDYHEQGCQPAGSVIPAHRALRIAFIADWCLPRFGGLELQLFDLAHALRARGHTVRIITSTPGPADLDGIPVHRLNGRRFPLWGFSASRQQFRELDAVMGEHAFDVLHIHSGIIAPLAYGAARIAAQSGIPTAFTFHSVYDYMRPALHLLSGIGNAARMPIAWSAVSTVVSREAAQALRRPSVDVLPNGIDPASWSVSSRLRVPGEFRLVSVGRLQVRKRPAALFGILDHAQQLSGHTVRVTLDIVGDGPERARVDRLALRAGADRVRVHGRLGRADIRALFGQSDAFLLPSRMESFGIAALEARCAGLPVIARTNTGVADFITHGQSGLLAHSDRGFAHAVADLASDDALYSKIAEYNRANIPPYSWDEVVALTLAQYDRAAALHT